MWLTNIINRIHSCTDMRSSFILSRLKKKRLAVLFAGTVAIVFAEKLFEAIQLSPQPPTYGQVICPEDHDTDNQELHISSTDFSRTHQAGKNETFQHTYCHSLYADKLIRDCIFDNEHILILSRKLSWFIQSAYILRLSPSWQPSIPIAHRKLII